MKNSKSQQSVPFALPCDVKRRIKRIVVNYQQMKEDCDKIINETYRPDGQPRGKKKSDPTASKAIRLCGLHELTDAVEYGLSTVPERCRGAIIDHFTMGVRYPHSGNLQTWMAFERKFLYNVAKRLGEI